MSKLVVTKKENGEFRFRLQNEKGLIIITSKPFSTKTACLKGIEILKECVSDKSSIEKAISTKQKPYFNIKTELIDSLAKSGIFDNDAKRDEGIKLMLSSLKIAVVEFEKIEKKKEHVALKKEWAKKESDDDFLTPKKNAKKRSHYS
jgi:uncharacterized protein YegP (UPF0339 family)